MTTTTPRPRSEASPAPAEERRPASPRGAVVVGYDASPAALEALVLAAGEARDLGAPLTVLHAEDFSASDQRLLADLAMRDLDEQVAAHARRVAEEGAATARRLTTTPVLALWRLVDPVRALVDVSREASLLVVGNRGRGTLRASLLGSTAFGTSAHAACPVLVVRTGSTRTPGPDRPVVVGADGSPSSGRALVVAADVAARTGAPLQVLTAWSVPAAGSIGAYGAISEQHLPHLREHAEQVSAEALARVRARHGDLEVEARVVRADPVRALRDASRGAGRVVVGTHGHGRLLSAVLGSVSQSAVHDCRCPVEVVPPEPAGGGSRTGRA
ncbi:universal stress protein [Pseudokineococcus marinus]|uniref:Universal stress protein n=1 Tax=Pseudokineococcus marinus TaxID=351215 RepID=A0A849BSN6_9ACTN|nr:universal stress protein [Pseudokineococcus marinus]NNH23832.1 universal stress protein [Pseudokineococcus marinus]